MHLSRRNVLWFAGLFEGEGSFELRAGRKSLGLQIKMTDLDVLEKAQQMFGGWIAVVKSRAAHHKQAWVWKLTKRDEAYALVAAMYQFLGARRQARACEWIEKYRSLKVIGRTSRHGFPGMYTIGGCRCNECKTAYSEYRKAHDRAYYARKKESARKESACPANR
jgi:hypothetical protein